MSEAIIQTDVVVVGAGPAGLFQLFQLGLQGIACHLVEALPHAGGQCAELYPHKPIYDIPGIPACTGRELVAQLQEQLRPFPIEWHWGQTVQSLASLDDGRVKLRTQQGLCLVARAVVLALGVGAFTPRPLKLEGVDALLNRQVFMQSHDRSAVLAQRKVVVYGGDEEAVARLLELASLPLPQRPAQLMLLHRRDVFKGSDAQLAQLQQLREANAVQVCIGQLQSLNRNEGGHLSDLGVLGADGTVFSLPLEVLLVYQGISPRLGTLEQWGLAMQQKALAVDPARFSTSLPGVYAIGDMASYPGKRKLIVCAFHEATLAAFAIAESLQQAPVLLQYTTTSTRLLQRLGRLPTHD